MSKSALTMAAVALVAMVTAATVAQATLVRSFSLTALSLEAHGILRGEVIDEEVVYDARYGEVFTDTHVRVQETLAGDARIDEVVVVRQIGGVLDGVETHVVGTVDFQIGDEIVTFTRTDGAFHYLVGMSQGAWALTRLGTGVTHLHRDLGAISPLPLPIPARRMAPDRLTLQDLRIYLDTVRTGGAR